MVAATEQGQAEHTFSLRVRHYNKEAQRCSLPRVRSDESPLQPVGASSRSLATTESEVSLGSIGTSSLRSLASLSIVDDPLNAASTRSLPPPELLDPLSSSSNRRVEQSKPTGSSKAMSRIFDDGESPVMKEVYALFAVDSWNS